MTRARPEKARPDVERAASASGSNVVVFAERTTKFEDHKGVVVQLTSLSHGAGCGCKLPASAIGALLSGLEHPVDPNILVSFETADDAGVYRLHDDLALVHTADFFTPIVDDPFDFGRIAATNALSDIYAMGATPVSALNLVAFSVAELGLDPLREILRGGAAVAAEAEVAIIGGHSIEDAEPKFGLAVIGTVHPDELLTNAGGQPGDALVLTKPLGAGAVSTALKRGGAAAALEEAVEVMTTLNRDASLAARRAGAHALTDVTGFGLLGHLHELALASGLAAEVEAGAVPPIRGVIELLDDPSERAVAGGTRRNRAHAEEFATFASEMPEALRWLVCDAMTSGGLLAAVPPGRASEVPGSVVGRLVVGEPGKISVR
jgi:selenide,water dikinase